MSYNPAFVADESPLANSDGANHDQSNGIKLISFKVLPKVKQNVVLDLSGDQFTVNQRDKLSRVSLEHHSSSPSPSPDRHNKQQQQYNHHHQHRNGRLHNGVAKQRSQTMANSTTTPASTKTPNATIKTFGGPPVVAPVNKTNGNFCMSTSSSLSLIDNPTLSSLTPSASSYSTTTSSIDSSSGLCAAVECRDMLYEIGKKTILYNINVTVPEGSIYGLLGPSGCGKTTMLRCVVGRIKPKSGYVRVFGYRPNDAGSQIPGPAIGYMPQEISVYEDFTINETLTYFGKINKMKQDLIDARIQFLLNFLDLPGKNRLIASLSGGQKRRVSLAAALVHSPPLLILDEPTVGVDPLLRQSIWKHLVTLAQTEKITVVITTHYIEEARQANVVGLMRHGKLLAEDSPDNLMSQHKMDNLEDVFLKLCISDSSRKAAKLAGLGLDPSSLADSPDLMRPKFAGLSSSPAAANKKGPVLLDANGLPIVAQTGALSERVVAKKKRQFPSIFLLADENGKQKMTDATGASQHQLATVAVVAAAADGSANKLAIESDSEKAGAAADDEAIVNSASSSELSSPAGSLAPNSCNTNNNKEDPLAVTTKTTQEMSSSSSPESSDEMTATSSPDFVVNKNNLRSMVPGTKYAPKKVTVATWSKSLMAVIWKNYIRLKRNPPVLIFEFILPAVQVILFCLCIGGDPFDVPLAVVNDEVIPNASRFFLDAIDKNAIRQVPFTNITLAIESVKRGETWGAIHIPDRYTNALLQRLTNPGDVTNETMADGTIKIYPDLTNLHLALAMENTFREAFIKFVKYQLNIMGYEPEVAELPIRVEKPVYGTMKRNGYLEFMAPGVVISITYVMATGLTALAFILEKRDGLLERSLVSGVTTSQILLAHASVQVIVMTIQISLVLAFTFFVFEIPSNGPFFWVVLLILLQGCTGMGFGLLVSAVCDEENTAVMMLVGTFYTNLILAGIIWPLEAMPRWLRWLSYAQPQTLPTETLRNILSRGWGIGETGVYVGFLVTIGWLVVFLLAAGLFMRYSK